MRKVATANRVTETTMKAVNDGMNASGAALGFADLPTTAVRFKIPYYVIQGRDDLFAPTPLVEAYFNNVSALKKRLFVIKGAGHFALATPPSGSHRRAETDPSLNAQNEAKVEPPLLSLIRSLEDCWFAQPKPAREIQVSEDSRPQFSLFHHGLPGVASRCTGRFRRSTASSR